MTKIDHDSVALVAARKGCTWFVVPFDERKPATYHRSLDTARAAAKRVGGTIFRSRGNGHYNAEG